MTKDNKQPYVQWYSSDFLTGVRGMSASQIGIYTILINEMYERCEPLPLNEKRLAWQCGCTKPTFNKALKMMLDEEKIIIKDDGLWNRRVEKEFKNRKKRSDGARTSANTRWKNANKNNSDSMQSQCNGNANAMLIPEARSQKLENTPDGVLPASGYEFEGNVIRLNKKDYNQWKKVYSTIPDFNAQLQAADDWISGESEKERKRWFSVVSGLLGKKHQKYVDEAKKLNGQKEKGRGMI